MLYELSRSQAFPLPRLLWYNRAMRILAVDHGEKRIGLALSDPSGTLAAPLKVIEHVSRVVDAAQVAAIAIEHDAGLVLIGQSFDEEGNPNAAGRRAARFAEQLKSQTNIPVQMWDESMSTQDARVAQLASGSRRSARRSRVDDLAAVMILQSYLDAQAGK